MGFLENTLPEYVIFSQLDKAVHWARQNSIAYLTLDLSCCGIEMLQVAGSRFDIERFGSVPHVSPRQADLMIVAGSVSYKIIPEIRKLYEQMSEPKYVLSLGSCANSGGMFGPDLSYSTLGGVDKIIPVDVYVPGCPPRPEAILNGLMLLQQKILSQRILVRDEVSVSKNQETNSND